MIHPTLRQRLHGLLATLAILLLVVGLPIVLVTIGATPWSEKLSSLPDLLTSPDDGTLALLIVAVVAWIAWAVIAISVVVEAAARVRGLPSPSLPGIAVPQRAVGQLIAVGALLFVATPTVVAAFPTAPTHAATAAPVLDAPRLAPIQDAPLAGPAAPVAAHAEAPTKHKSTVDYAVKRGDSLWKIADRLLGDGARFPEIVELNAATLNGRPDFIVSGTVLKVPYEARETSTERPGEEYVVAPGDTLSEIAEAKLGDPARYGELFTASRNTVQPDGAKLTDPNLIRPGWDITIPDQAKHKADVPEKPIAVVPPVHVEPPVRTPTETPTPSVDPTPTPAASTTPRSTGTPHKATDDVEASAPGWLVPGLSGAGAVLAGLVLLAIRAHRNTQLRYRRPGQTIAPPPPELRAIEETAFISGAPQVATIESLDRALIHLAGICEDEGRALPQLVTATLTRGTVNLHLADDAALPEPWTGTGREWSLLPDTPLEVRDDMLPPYPLLVTLGQDDSDELHLVNLEHLGVISLTGDRDRTAGLARHIAAELALNPWSVLVEVSVIGLGEELAVLDSLRLHHHVDGKQVVPAIARSLATSLENGWADPDPYRAIVTAGDGTGELGHLLSSPTSRLGAAVVSLAAPIPESTVLDVDETGQLRAPALGLRLRAAGLTSEEARACAAIVDLTRESEPTAVAPFAQAADGWRALADQAGALREELTDVREEGPAGDGSLLPNAAEEYVEVAATTVEDVETLAPVVSNQVRHTVEDADPQLDEDVADWLDDDHLLPRLQVLGPVRAFSRGNVLAVAKRRPYFVELLAYLALHPEGVFSRDLAETFGIKQSRARTDMSIVREWLGTNPRTGELYLPLRDSHAPQDPNHTGYGLNDLLVDVDLFRRLRLRGQARGTSGIEDLKTALNLVAGKPFSNLRENGWAWLFEDDRLHEIAPHMIVDTAHVIAVAAQAEDDLDTARWAAETACEAAPYDEICRLDLVKVATAQGHVELAERILNHDVFNRADDHLPPIDLPERTREVVEKQGWGKARRRPT